MIAVAILSFIIFLFSTYQYSRDDFVFLRKNIALEQVFNIIFLGLIIALISARIGYVIFHPSLKFLNPLVFFAFPYFPGFSFLGGTVGVSCFAFMYFYRKKMPAERLFDMYTVAFFAAWACYTFFQAAFDSVLRSNHVLPDSILFVLSCIIAIFFGLRFRVGMLIDGSICSLGIFFFSLCMMLWSIVFYSQTHITFLTPEFIATGIFGLVGLGIFLKKLFSRKKALKK